MARKTKQETERTYHLLLDSAAQLFTQKGVSKTTLNDIASHAGMTRGAVYWHFDNKDNVIMALWQRNASAFHQEFLEQMQLRQADQPAMVFRSLIKGVVQQIANEPELAQVMRIVMNNVELTEEQTELQVFMQDKKELLRKTLNHAFELLDTEGLLKTSLRPALLTRGLLAYLHGLIHAYLEPGRQKLNLKEHGDSLLDLYLDTILT